MGTQMELVARRKDGTDVMVEIALSPLREPGQQLVVAAIRSIGSYPRVQQALRRANYSEHLARMGHLAVDALDPKAVLDLVPVIATQALQVEVATVYLLDSDHLALRVASGVGSPPGEALGARIPYRPDSASGLVLAQGVPLAVHDYRSERRFVVPDSYLDAGVASALEVPLSDRGRTIGTLAVRSRRAQRFGDDEVRFLESMASLLATSLQRAQAEEALNHAQRLESVGQLTGGIAHDFNNLLTVIQGNLQVLEELPALAGDAYAQQLVGAAARATRRGAELTSKLLTFSRRQLLQPTHVDVSTLLHSLSDMLRRTLDQRIRIEVDAPPGPVPVLVDAGQFESALLNIAINARDAMPDGGTLRIRAIVGAPLPAGMRVELEDARLSGDRFVAISIADTGTGMTDKVKERAFEPFFTTKAAGRGTGLGLSTVYGFVKQSKGAIAIDSAPGAGTTVTLFIPRPWKTDTQASDEDRAGSAALERLSVLLVEDDAEVRAVVRAHLDTLDGSVTEAASGEQALAALAPDASFDLLVTDVALGSGMRGTELAALARHRFPGLAILLMSGFSAELLDGDRNPQPWQPRWELLRKPFTRGELARAIAAVVTA
jgi:signal transduction histidine kinase